MHDDSLFHELGILKADDENDDTADNAQNADGWLEFVLWMQGQPPRGTAEKVPRPEGTLRDMGARAVARSAEGLTVLNTLEVLPPYQFSV